MIGWGRVVVVVGGLMLVVEDEEWEWGEGKE